MEQAYKASRLSITLWTELAKRGHWSAGIEKIQLHQVNKNLYQTDRSD